MKGHYGINIMSYFLLYRQNIYVYSLMHVSVSVCLCFILMFIWTLLSKVND